MSKYYREARRRARQKIGFYKHLKIYVVVNVFMAAMLVFKGHAIGWFPTPFFWGIALFLHYVKVFGLPGTDGLYTEDWERRIFDEEMDKIKKEDIESDDLELRQMDKEPGKAWDDKDLV